MYRFEEFSKPEHRSTMLGCVHESWTAGWRPLQCGIEITLRICRVQIFGTQFRCGWAGKFELPVIETGARGAEKWLEPKWHQFTTAPKHVSIFGKNAVRTVPPAPPEVVGQNCSFHTTKFCCPQQFCLSVIIRPARPILVRTLLC